MDFPKESVKIVGIDFETANEKRSSVCSIGISILSNDDIYTYHRYVRPPDMRFNRENVAIHGITPEMVENKMNFKQLYNDTWVGEFFREFNVMWAHNAGFESSCIKSLNETYGINVSSNIACTMLLWKRLCPNLENHKLPTICNHLGVKVENHHDAGYDAEMCVRVLLSTIKKHDVDSLVWSKKCKTKERDLKYYKEVWGG
jgi:DNA polymerase III subunit epsilon